MKSIVTLFDAKKGMFISEQLYSLPPMKALICAVEQYKGNFNTWDYPDKLDGIYKSNIIESGLLYNINDLIMYSQEAW